MYLTGFVVMRLESVNVLSLIFYFGPLQVMLDFQAAERQRLEEPASDVGLESLCALVVFCI
jgi:exocyst complex component 3